MKINKKFISNLDIIAIKGLPDDSILFIPGSINLDKLNREKMKKIILVKNVELEQKRK